SAFAERLATRLAAGAPAGVLYLATARGWDEEMAARVAAHRTRRPDPWATGEAPLDPLGALRGAAAGATAGGGRGGGARSRAGWPAGGERVVLLDSVDMWVSNRLLEAAPVVGERVVPVELTALEAALSGEAEALAGRPERMVVVTLEAGMGVVPPS